jgi:hypothetical protein
MEFSLRGVMSTPTIVDDLNKEERPDNDKNCLGNPTCSGNQKTYRPPNENEGPEENINKNHAQ